MDKQELKDIVYKTPKTYAFFKVIGIPEGTMVALAVGDVVRKARSPYSEKMRLTDGTSAMIPAEHLEFIGYFTKDGQQQVVPPTGASFPSGADNSTTAEGGDSDDDSDGEDGE